MSNARLLDRITEWPSDPAFSDTWNDAFDKTKPCPYHNCYRGFGGIWQVKLFLGGEQRIIGESYDRLRAVRFADMCLVRFAKYRTRRNRPLTDDDVNFSLRTANSDLAGCPAATEIINNFEKWLLLKGLIAEARADAQTDRRTPQQVNRDLRLHFRKLRSDYARTAERASFYPGAQVALDMVADYMDKLEKLNETLFDALYKDGLADAQMGAMPAATPTTA
jgi:hypothetical protein